MRPFRTCLLITAVYSSLIAGSESALVRIPSNTTVVEGSAVTLHCSSDVGSENRWTTTLTWYKVARKSFPCAEHWHWNVALCLGEDAELLHSGFSVADPPPRFNVTAGDNSTHVTRDLRINAVQLTDAGYYVCAEQRIDDFGSIQNPSVAQLIVVCGETENPLYGPIAGGTRVCISGQFLSGFKTTAALFGEHKGDVDEPKSSEKECHMIAVSPSVNLTECRIRIKLELDGGSSYDTGLLFDYRPNPVIDDITPRRHLTSGGTRVTIEGRFLNSVAQPSITQTTIITPTPTPTMRNDCEETEEESCYTSQGITMICPMPKVCLTKELNYDLYNISSQTINSTEGPGVAQFVSPNGLADIYIGIRLDGYRYYENISALYHPSNSTSPGRGRGIENEKFTNTYRVPPKVNCSDSGPGTPIEFNPDKDNTIAIRGMHFSRINQLADINVTLGVSKCEPIRYTDVHIYCKPPPDKPNKNISDASCHQESDWLSMSIYIGFEKYSCCVRYVEEFPLFLVLTAVLVFLVVMIIAIIAINIVLRRRRRQRKKKEQSKPKENNAENNTTDTSTELEIGYDEVRYRRDLSDNSVAEYHHYDDIAYNRPKFADNFVTKGNLYDDIAN